MAVLGVTEHPDPRLSRRRAPRHRPRGGGGAHGRALITEVAPDIIVTFGPDGTTFHPDHITVHHWVTAAWERLQQPAQLLYSATTAEHLARFADLYEEWGVYMTDERPVGVRPVRGGPPGRARGPSARPQAGCTRRNGVPDP